MPIDNQDLNYKDQYLEVAKTMHRQARKLMHANHKNGLKEGHFLEAIEILKDAVSRAGSDTALKANIYYDTARAEAEMGKFAESIEDFTKTINIHAQNGFIYPLIFASRGEAYREWGKYDEAIEDFNKTLKIQTETDDKTIYIYRGLYKANMAIGNKNDAAKALAKCSEMFLSYDYNKALDCAEGVIEANPNWIEGYFLKAHSLLKLGKSEDLGAVLNACTEGYKKTTNIYEQSDILSVKAAIKLSQSLVKDAKKYAKEALKLDNKNDEAKLTLAHCYKHQKKFDKAIEKLHEIDAQSNTITTYEATKLLEELSPKDKVDHLTVPEEGYDTYSSSSDMGTPLTTPALEKKKVSKTKSKRDNDFLSITNNECILIWDAADEYLSGDDEFGIATSDLLGSTQNDQYMEVSPDLQ